MVEKSLSGQQILVVEDDPFILSYLKVLLASLDYSFTALSDGRDAVRLLTSDGHFNLLFTDIRLGGEMDGFTVARMAHSLRPEMGVLFTSGSLYHTEQFYAVTPQFRGFIRKPYRKKELDDAIQLALAPQG